MRKLLSIGCAALLALAVGVGTGGAQVIGPGGVFDSVTTPVGISASVAATPLYSVVVPAGLAATPRFTCDLIGRIVTDTNARSATLTAAYGNQTLTLINAATVTATTGQQEFWWRFSVGKTGSTTAHISGTAIIGSGTAAAAQVFMEGTQGTQTLATTTNRTLIVTWTWGAATSSVTVDNVVCRVG